MPRNQILGGHTVNRDVWNGGAQLHKSQNIGWARACVPTVHIWPCKYTAKMHLWARSKVGFTQPLLWDSSKDMSRTKVRPICPFLFSKGSHCAPICFVFCKLCFDFWRKTAKSGCLCKGTLQKLPNFLFEKNHKVTKKQKTNWRCLKKWQKMLLIHTTEYLVRKLMPIIKICHSNSCVIRLAKSPFLDTWVHIKFWHFTAGMDRR